MMNLRVGLYGGATISMMRLAPQPPPPPPPPPLPDQIKAALY